MIDNRKYIATNMTTGLLIQELRLTAILIKEGLTEKEIRIKSKSENIYQARSENFIQKVTSAALKRINTLDNYLIEKLSNSDIDTAKHIAIYSVMKSDRLFFEFMNEVYKEKIILRDFKIKDIDISIFIQRKQEQVQTVANWASTTTKRLINQYILMLHEANYIEKNKNNVEVIIPIIDKSTKEHLIEVGDVQYLKAMIGEL